MHRICDSLSAAGYRVVLIGRKLPASLPLPRKNYKQVRLNCLFKKGKLFYAEYNLRLFFYLLFCKIDAVCAIDLDTILPCYYISRIKKCKRVYDAHELFTGLKEVESRPGIQKAWLKVERTAVPHFSNGYTVSDSVADELHRRYGVKYDTIRNLPVLQPLHPEKPREKFILYQGAVNEARAFEFLIPAMRNIKSRLVVCGDGNFMPQLKKLIEQYNVQEKVELRGMLLPAQLWEVATTAYLGIAVAENEGLNQYLALPNKFLDYFHAGLPQVTMDYPEYRKINSEFEIAVLIGNLDPVNITAAVNNLLDDTVLYERLRNNCFKAREVLNWQEEEKKLLAFYNKLFAA
jgi:glycosyltransferase involved in cell wall biosynthesis